MYRKREKVRIDFCIVDPECSNSGNHESYTSTRLIFYVVYFFFPLTSFRYNICSSAID